MADTTTALTNLQRAIVSAATAGPFVLDASFLANGLADPEVVVPSDYDDILSASFQVDAKNFTVVCSTSAVGPVGNGQFVITAAIIRFIGDATAKTPATLTFSTTTEGSVTYLSIDIASSPENWSWGNSFPYMSGWPFNQLSLSAVKFGFSSQRGAVQTFKATLAWPAVAQPFLILFEGLSAPASVAFSGQLNMDAYGGPTFSSGALMPVGTISAPLSENDYTFAGYLKVSRPALSLLVPAPTSGNAKNAADSQQQAANLVLSAYLHVEGADALSFQIRVLLYPSKGNILNWSVSLAPSNDQGVLSPASALALMGNIGGASYFEGMPTVLQQYLTSFGLTGLNLNGRFGKSDFSVTQIGVQLGTPPGVDVNWQPLPAPTPKFNFAVHAFALDWSCNSPFSKPQFSYLFNTTFSILPAVFKSVDGSSDGIFMVEFSSDQIFTASFDGSAKLSDFLDVVSNGIIVLPTSVSGSGGIDMTVSNIALELDIGAKDFSFSSDIDIDISFLSAGAFPVLSLTGGNIALSAVSASSADGVTASDGSGTVWSGNFSGLLNINSFSANCSVAYDGIEKIWELEASLTDSLNINNLITQFFSLGGAYYFPDFLPGTLIVDTFDISATIPLASGSKTSYTVSTDFNWTFNGFGSQSVAISDANLSIQYDGSRFSGSASGTWVYDTIGFALGMEYAFKADGSKTLAVSWQGFTATWVSAQNQVTFSLKGWTLGSLVQTLVATLGDPYFTLPSPWNLLNQISLDGLQLNVSLDNVKNRVSGSYTLSSPLNLGFIIIKGLTLTRNTSGKVMMVIDGIIPPQLNGILGPLTDPEQGQDVQNMPEVPGQGTDYFKLYLLALGQRVSIYQPSTGFDSTASVIAALEKIPATGGKENPLNLTTPTPGQPYYNSASNWLIASHMGVMKSGNDWMLDLQLVFNDPELYGMRIETQGEKAGPLAGLIIDILYKKITDDIGLFDIQFTFPDSIRNLNFGAVSVVLPSIGIQIYTNGDFYIDLGFPTNLDFSRSFSFSAIVFGVPVLGSGGLYFGKLSNATATQVPKTDNGTFNPVIVFGLGMQLGLGYNFVAGPLKAGFALTLLGVIEGVIATYHPYQNSSGGGNVTVQDSNYFKLKGTVGLIGMLYGTIDFKIITASVLVNITLSVQIVYESYRSIPISATASVKVSVKVRINLGLFKITISLSFQMTVTATFTIGSDSTAPWDQGNRLTSARGGLGRSRNYSDRQRALPLEARRQLLRQARRTQPKRILQVASGNVVKPILKLVCAPQYTVLAPPGANEYAAQQGAFVTLFAMDAPDATATQAGSGDTSFDLLCAAFFPWLIDLLQSENALAVDLAAVSASSVTLLQLQSDLDWLGDTNHTAFTSAELLQFMADTFTVNISNAGSDTSSATLFPLFDGLILNVPAADGSDGLKTITLETYTTATDAYRIEVSKLLQQVAVSMNNSNIDHNGQPSGSAVVTDVSETQSMASFVFVDVFTIIARGLLQAAVNVFDNYAYAVQSSDSIAGIVNGFNAIGNAITADDVSIPNAAYPLTESLILSIPETSAVIQTADTLQSIAARYSDTVVSGSRWVVSADDLIVANSSTETGSGGQRILQAGVTFTLTLSSGKVTYTTVAGDNFGSIAIAVGISVAQLAAQTVLYDIAGLLIPGTSIVIPEIAYRTASASTAGGASTDTLDSIAGQFAISVANLGQRNANVLSLFASSADAPGHLAIAYLDVLSIAQIWSAIQVTADVGQIAGQVARFVSYGLRLPMANGLTLSAEFLYPSGQAEYALYQLTGQQFPTPPAASDYQIQLSRSAKVGNVDLSFIQFGDGSETQLTVPLADPFAQLEIVLQYAQAGKFVPAPAYSNLPLVALKPKQLATASYSMWNTSDNARLRLVTANSDSNSISAIPYLWSLPGGLVTLLQQRQSALQDIFGESGYARSLSLMPAFAPRRGSNSPNDPQTMFVDIDSFAFATRIDFQITRLPVVSATSASGESDNVTDEILATTYQLLGPSAADAQLLEFLLTGIAAVGDDLISGLFLLYNAGGSDVVTLSGSAESSFLSFIAQTNLSTESHPPANLRAMALAATVDAVSGIANTPSQFIKLLWEQSVVQGGGYYLYWEDLQSGSGLPAAIFDDNGNAMLTLVVTLNRANKTLANFVNAFVTTSAIDPQSDVVVLESLSSQAQSAPLGANGSETLTSIAALYGIGVGQLVAVNSNVALRSGLQLPVQGILHQITATEGAEISQTLNVLAAYYSVGALTPVTAQNILDYNPGVTVSVGATVRIPPLVYQVNPTLAGGPGNTFANMAAYYSLSVQALAVSAAMVSAPYAASTTINIDTLEQDSQATQDPGNMSFMLERKNLGVPEPLPQNPTQQQIDDFSAQTLYSLYNTLSAGLAANPYFSSSLFSLPFGPQDNSSDTDNLNSNTSLQARSRARQAQLASLAEQDYQYSQVVGYIGKDSGGKAFSQINPVPSSSLAGLPPASANPYIGIGSYASTALRWQDLFGNTTVTPFEKVPANYKGTLNKPPAALLYTDRLLGLSAWPKVQATYIYGGQPGAATLEVTLSMDGSLYMDADDSGTLANARQDLATFQQIYFQLNQDYSGLGIPGLSGNAVSMTLTNTLLLNPETALNDAQAQQVRDFVSACVIFLQNFVDGTQTVAPTSVLTMPVDVNALGSDNLIALDVGLTLMRNSLLVEPLIAGLPDGVAVRSGIAPQTNLASESSSSSYTLFATALETVLQTATWEMKAGAGLSKSGSASGQGLQQLFAVRFGKSAGNGIYFQIGEKASYYAPLPIAKSLENDTVTVNIYPANQPHKISFNGIDLNLWFSACLNAIDKFLSATYAPAAFILDKQNGIDDPLVDGELGKILLAKQNLADAISNTVSPILSSSATDADSIAAARSTMQQQLLNTLAPAFNAGAAVVFDLDQVSGSSTDNPAGPPSLYGQPAKKLASNSAYDADNGNQNYALSTARIPLVGTDGRSPKLAFSFTSKNVAGQAYVPLNLQYQISHMEFDLTTVPGIQNYIESQWLVFINGPFNYALGDETHYIPVVNRALPTPPTMKNQIAAAHLQNDSSSLTPADLAQWNYAFTYTYPQAAQDAINMTITLNSSPPPMLYAAVDEPDLFAALADFISNYPAIAQDIDTYLLKINGQAVEQSVLDQATLAVSNFQTRVSQVASSYMRQFNAMARFTGAEDVSVPIVFDLRLEDDGNGNALYSLLDLTMSGISARWNNANNTISNGSITLAAPVIEVQPEQYTATPVSNPPDNVTLAYYYVNSDGSRLSLAQAQADPERTVVLPELNVMVYKNARSSLFAQRNKFLVPDTQIETVQTMPEFLFSTPVVQFTDPILPRLSWQSYSLRNVQPVGGDDVTAYMAGFFNALFEGAGGTLKLSMAGGYEYDVVPSIPTLPRTYLPVNMLTPATIAIDPAVPPASGIALTRQMANWYALNQPVKNGNAAMTFNFSLFSNLSSEQLVFSIKDLYWTVNAAGSNENQ